MVQGWNSGFIVIREPRLLSFYTLISICGLHPEGCFMEQNSCWSTSHHACLPDREKKITVVKGILAPNQNFLLEVI